MDVAKADGATVAAGGARFAFSSDGNFVSPTLFTGARTGMRIAQEEIFGPVLTVIPFEDEAEAVCIGNDVRYGLAGYLWTGDVGRAHPGGASARCRHDLGQLPKMSGICHRPSAALRRAASAGTRRLQLRFLYGNQEYLRRTGDHRIPQMGA